MTDPADFVGLDLAYLNEIKHKIVSLPSAESLSKNQINKFLAESDAIVVEADDYIHVSDVLDCYFNSDPPFHKDNPKKEEFPDAIALLSLEAWAEEEEREIVVVSRDADWIAFCEKSEKLHLVKDLATALALFQSPDKAVEKMVEDLRAMLNDPTSEVVKGIESDIRDFNWKSHVTIDVDSQFQWEEDDSEIEIKNVFLLTRKTQ